MALFIVFHVITIMTLVLAVKEKRVPQMPGEVVNGISLNRNGISSTGYRTDIKMDGITADGKLVKGSCIITDPQQRGITLLPRITIIGVISLFPRQECGTSRNAYFTIWMGDSSIPNWKKCQDTTTFEEGWQEVKCGPTSGGKDIRITNINGEQVASCKMESAGRQIVLKSSQENTEDKPGSSNAVAATCVKTKGGACCKFPFVKSGKKYYACVESDDNPSGCATTSNYDKDKLWGNCPKGSPRVIETAKGLQTISYVNKMMREEKSRLLTTLSAVGKIYTIVFYIKRGVGKMTFHFTQVPKSYNKDETPAIWFDQDSAPLSSDSFRICAVVSEKKYCVGPFSVSPWKVQWTSVKIMQVASGSFYEWQVYLDEEMVHKTVNKKAQKLKNVKVYNGKPGMVAVTGFIWSLQIRSKVSEA